MTTGSPATHNTDASGRVSKTPPRGWGSPALSGAACPISAEDAARGLFKPGGAGSRSPSVGAWGAAPWAALRREVGAAGGSSGDRPSPSAVPHPALPAAGTPDRAAGRVRVSAEQPA